MTVTTTGQSNLDNENMRAAKFVNGDLSVLMKALFANQENSALGELYFRRNLCRALVQIVSGTDDPRRDDALKEYQRQLAEIDAKIETLEGKPPDVVVGLKTARLFGKSEMR